MSGAGRWILVWLALLTGAQFAAGQGTRERRAFEDATNAFNYAASFPSFWDRAEQQFADFNRHYPQSKLRTDAVFRQAQAQFQLKDYIGVISLLSTNVQSAGLQQDQYRDLLAEAFFYQGNFFQAAQTYHVTVADFPASPFLLKAAVGEAQARARMSEWPRVVDLLQNSAGVFQRLALANPTNALVAHGFVQLGEAQFAQTNFDGTASALTRLSEMVLPPDLDWRRWHLQCRLELSRGQPGDALRDATNHLSQLAEATRQPALQAESASFEADLFCQLGRPDEAMAQYERNLTGGAPENLQREAMLNIADLSLAQGKFGNAIEHLQSFLMRFTNAPAMDTALLALGELQLRQALTDSESIGTNIPANASASSNLIREAQGHFDELARRFSSSELVGKAMLDRGWCVLIDGKIPESRDAFHSAVERLGLSYDQAVARFKLADAEYALDDFPGAVSDYQAIDGRYNQIPGVKKDLYELALYQLVQAALRADNLAAATNALAAIFENYPGSIKGPSALLLAGQGFVQRESPAAARTLFTEFLNKLSPGNGQATKIDLAIARTYEAEKNYAAAITNYDSWLSLASHTNEMEFPETLYRRAWDTWMDGKTTNALAMFQEFQSKFPTNEFSPWAQYWIGGYYFDTRDWRLAEQYFQVVAYTNQPVSILNYQAQMMAGRCAMERSKPEDATYYFTNLASNLRCPAEIRVQAEFANADAIESEAAEMKVTDTNREAKFAEAIRAYDHVTTFPQSYEVPLAWGQKADCYLELAATDPAQFTNSIKYYEMVLNATNAGVSARSQARFGLGLVAEKRAELVGAPRNDLLMLAYSNYCDVLLGTDLRDAETPDYVFWVPKAGEAAATLAEEKLKDWQRAVDAYGYMAQHLPVMPPGLEEKLAKAKKRATEGG